MPKSVIETAVPINSDSPSTPRLGFFLVQKSDDFPTVVSRLHVKVVVFAQRDDGGAPRPYERTYHVGDELDELDPGDAAAGRAFLSKFIDQLIADESL